jgi:gluconate 5-dehydrogenase
VDGAVSGIEELLRLDGKVALVTGAVAGLGFEIARAYIEAGATVGIHGRDLARAEAAAARIGGEALAFDLADRAAMAGAVDRFLAAHGRIDVLVLNAGARDRRLAVDINPDAFADLMGVNLTGSYAVIHRALPSMIANGGGSILFVTSNAAHRGYSHSASYAASKAGLESLTRSLARELGVHRIRVNAISPGFFATEHNAAMVEDPAVDERIDRLVPLRRWGQPHEIAGPALLLASDAGAYINGHSLVVDGGSLATG